MMRKKLITLLFLLYCAINLFIACEDSGGQPDRPDHFRISIRDAETYENLVGNGDKLYHIDSLKLTNLKGEERYLFVENYNSQNAGAYFNEYFVEVKFDAFNSWKIFNQTYGEKFDTIMLLYYNQYDTDTLRFIRSKGEVSIYKDEILLTESDSVPFTTILPKTKEEQELSKP